MSLDPAREFLDTIANIEKTLKLNLRTQKFTPLRTLAKTSRSAGALTEAQYAALIALAELRNALSHDSYRDGKPIAMPHPAAIDEAKRLLAYLKKPPLAMDLLERYPIRMVSPMDSMAQALEHVQHDYSQFPIYESHRYVGLLTTNAIGRWLADQCESGLGIRAGATVADLFEFAESSDIAVPMRADATAVEAIHVLGNDDGPVRAVIFTNSGDIDDAPLAVAVREDVHRLQVPLR